MEIDTDQLEGVLAKLSQDLAQPFLERRGREQLHKQSLVPSTQVEELRDVVNLLNQRERELAAAVGIAQMLLAKGKSSFSALDEAKEQIETLNRTLRAHQQEIEILREALLTAEERHIKASALLVDAETTIQTLTGESQHYQEHLKTLQRPSRPDSKDVLVGELSDRLTEQAAAFERKQ